MIQRLLKLELKNFRLFKHLQRLDLDADVVLIYGKNGAGKSSLLGGLEYAVTGAVSDLERWRADYPHCLQHVYSRGKLRTRLKYRTGSGALGVQSLGSEDLSGLRLPADERRRFSERCCLSQIRLGRLLEEYQKPDPRDKVMPLVRFLYEFLSQGQLDNLTVGLNLAFQERRPSEPKEREEYLEGRVKYYQTRTENLRDEVETFEIQADRERRERDGLLAALDLDLGSSHGLKERLGALRSECEARWESVGGDRDEVFRQLGTLEALKSFLKGTEAGASRHKAAELEKLEKESRDLERRLEDLSGGDEADPFRLRTWSELLAAAREHLQGDLCPVCGRDYGELEEGSLGGRIAESLTEIGAELERGARRVELSARLVEVRSSLVERRKSLLRSEEELSTLVREAGLDPGSAPAVDRIADLEAHLRGRREELEREVVALDRRREQIEDLEDLLQDLEETERGLEKNREALERESCHGERAIQALERVRNLIGAGKKIRYQAREIQMKLLQGLIEGKFNDLWQDLFRRLVRRERFAPLLGTPKRSGGRLKTTTRARAKDLEKEFEQLGSVLSSGNLNTAGLTLYLALHLLEKEAIPILILDDPIQNMDDHHLVQISGLLRSIAQDHGRQVFVAVHERELFDYLAIELGPTSRDDRLVTIEVERDADGRSSSVQWREHVWVPDHVRFGLAAG